jgi:signal transduction histidine kinase
LEAVVPEGLPKVHADPDRLPRIMTSLLFHARKFRTSGAVSVSVQPRQDGKRVEFCVEYHGPALTPAEAKRTLDLYFPARQRGDQSLTATGLGLGVLRALMRLQGGDLEHETDGKGRSRLRLSIPANP